MRERRGDDSRTDLNDLSVGMQYDDSGGIVVRELRSCKHETMTDREEFEMTREPRVSLIMERVWAPLTPESLWWDMHHSKQIQMQAQQMGTSDSQVIVVGYASQQTNSYASTADKPRSR